jgi:phage RecT family recombinase
MGELVRQLVDRNRESIVQRLPRYLTPEQFLSLCYNLDRNPKLAAVAQRNPDSLLNAILKAADAGLMIGSAYDHCAIAPFGDEVQLMVQYRGLVYQLIHAGAVLKISAACVYDGDDFDLRLGDEELLEHRPKLDDERRNDPRWLFDKKNIRGAYAVAWLPIDLRPGIPLKQHRWCPTGEVERARLVSRNGDGPNSPWTLHYPAMATKTAVRRLTKLIEVCGKTDENREAWDRFNRTMDIEDAEYKHVEEAVDDVPGEKPVKSAPRPGQPRAAEVTSAERSTPPPQDRGARRKQATTATAAPPPPPIKAVAPPPPAPVDELISSETQNDLIDKTTGAGLKPTWLFDHIQEKYGVGVLKDLRQSQANEIEQYLLTLEN